MSTLDKDFEKIAEEINAKIKEAGRLLKEVNEIAKDSGMDYIHTYGTQDGMEKLRNLIDMDPVFNQIDNAGWSISSLTC